MPEESSFAPYVVPTVVAVSVFLLAALVHFTAKKNSSIKRLGEILRTGSFLDSTVLSITIGILLINSGIQNYLFAPGVALGESFPHMIFRFAQIVIGTGLVVGTFTRLCTIGIIALFAGGFFFFPPLEMLDYIVFMGVGFFLFLVHRDVLSFSFFFQPLEKKGFLDKYRKHALPILRFITGIGLVFISINHNIIDPEPAIKFLQERPILNISHSVLVLNAGIFGALLGTLLAFGFIPRFVSTIIAIGLVFVVIVGGPSFLPIAVPYFAIAYIVITGNQFEEREIKEKL